MASSRDELPQVSDLRASNSRRKAASSTGIGSLLAKFQTCLDGPMAPPTITAVCVIHACHAIDQEPGHPEAARLWSSWQVNTRQDHACKRCDIRPSRNGKREIAERPIINVMLKLHDCFVFEGTINVCYTASLLMICIVYVTKLSWHLKKALIKNDRSIVCVLKAAVMKVDPFPADCCPTKHKDLLLIETRFEGLHCFAELQCRVCRALWKAEIGPMPGSAAPFANGLEDQPGWRVLSLTPHTAH